MPQDPICWALTEGFAGMENQCLGLAEAVGIRCEVKHVRRPRAPLTYLSPRFWPNPLARTTNGIPLAPPWPDLLISSGRGSVAAALAIRKASRNRTFAVHVQRPYARPSRFDLVVVPLHDSLRGDNVLVARTALHRITSEKLRVAAQRFKPALSHLPRPLIAVLVGGSNKHQRFSADTMRRLARDLVLAVEECRGSLAVTPSRRTGEENERILRERLNSVPAFFWDGTGENPYLGLLALADAIVVTSDSVSMVSEASATAKPIHIFAIGDGGRKLRRFHKALVDDGVTRSFTATIQSWSYHPPDETGRIAALVRERLEASSGNSC
jgi:mitochondrial fission protein ELM1